MNVTTVVVIEYVILKIAQFQHSVAVLALRIFGGHLGAKVNVGGGGATPRVGQVAGEASLCG